MLRQDQIDSIAPVIQTTQIINAALIMGLLVFGAVAATIVTWDDVHMNFTIMPVVGLLFALMGVGISVVVPRLIDVSAARTTAGQMKTGEHKSIGEKGIQRIAGQFQVRHIVQMALIEGAAFMNLLLFVIDHSLVALIVAGLCLMFLFVGFPSSNRIVNWTENQLERIQDHLREG